MTNELITACINCDYNKICHLLEINKNPEQECLYIICENIGNSISIFYKLINYLDPDTKCLEILCTHLDNNNFKQTLKCIKKIITLGVNIDQKKLLPIIDSNYINNDELVKILREICSIQKEKLELYIIKKIMKKNITTRLLDQLKEVDEECYNLLISESHSSKELIMKQFLRLGLKVNRDMLIKACSYKNNKGIINCILNYCKNIVIDNEIIEIICDHTDNCDLIIKFKEHVNDDIMLKICRNGSLDIINYFLKRNKITEECFTELCYRNYELLLIELINNYSINLSLKHLNIIVRWCKNNNGLIDLLLNNNIKPDYKSLYGNLKVKNKIIKYLDKNEYLLHKAYSDDNLLNGLENFKLLLELGIKPSDKFVRKVCKTYRHEKFVNLLIEFKKKINIKFNINCLRYICKQPVNEYNIAKLISFGIIPDIQCLENACNVSCNQSVILQLMGRECYEEEKLITKICEKKNIQGVYPNYTCLLNVCQHKGNKYVIQEILMSVEPTLECLKLANIYNFSVEVIKEMIDKL